jgi:thymidylate synthase (FAD)
MPRHIVENAEKWLDKKVPVLDHGGVALIEYMGSDKAIEQAARVSFIGNEEEKRSEAQTRGLIRYLVRHMHTTPLEMVELKFWIKCPLFVARQWHRHRTASINEISGRYAEMPDEFYLPELKRMSKQSVSNKQGSSEEIIDRADAVRDMMALDQEHSRTKYELALDEGLAKELSRINLPLSQYTEYIWKIDLHNLMHFLRLRLDPHAQYEIRAFAEVMSNIVKDVCPLAWEAFEDYRLKAETVSRMEAEIIRENMKTSLHHMKDETLAAYLKNKGLSKREIKEFVKKFDISFDLSYLDK